MSAISGFGSGSQLAHWLEAIRKKQTSLVATGTTSTPSTTSTPGTTSTPSIGTVAGAGTTTASAATQFTAAASASAKPHKHGGSQFFAKIQQTVTNALQAAKANGSTEDPNEIVQDSIASLLKNMGVGGSAAQTALAANSNTEETATADPATTQQTFETLLQSSGISPEQFQSDFVAAIQEAQGGAASPTSGIGSLLKGAILDVAG
jgi:hypothetical protein